MSDYDVQLCFASFEEIADELAKRFTHVIVAVEEDVRNNPAAGYTRFFHAGGFSSAIGLAVRMRRYLMKQTN